MAFFYDYFKKLNCYPYVSILIRNNKNIQQEMKGRDKK
jgi:hypothetical protein